MANTSVSAAAFAANLLDHVLLGGSALPAGIAGLSSTEIECFNHYLTHPIPDRSLARSQLHQDLWVAFLLDCWNPHSLFHRHGYFVEFGALDGVTMSNSYLFEKQFEWNGILAEPAPMLFNQCMQRRACITDSRCIWRTSGNTVTFNEVTGKEELATVDEFSDADFHAETRKGHKKIIEVLTVSLVDLLSEHGAPNIIDYLSVDTEGSEFEILKVFDFSRYAFRTISIEHNFTSQRQQIFKLLSANGYERLAMSTERFDDLYVRPDLLPPQFGRPV